MARPRLVIDKNVVAGMAFAGASSVDIANFVGCAEATVTCGAASEGASRCGKTFEEEE